MDNPSLPRAPDAGQDATPLDKLTPKERALVEYHVEHGGPIADAITHAGYAHPNGGYQAWQRDRVKDAVVWLSRERLGSLIPTALSTLDRLLSAKSEKVRLDAALAVLDRAGLSPSAGQQGPGGGGSIMINIDLGSDLSDRAGVVDLRPNEGGGGEKPEGGGYTTSPSSVFQTQKPAGGG